MTESEAVEILKDFIVEDNRLYNGYNYTAWSPEDSSITLDGDFDSKTLSAMVWWMEHKSIK